MHSYSAKHCACTSVTWCTAYSGHPDASTRATIKKTGNFKQVCDWRFVQYRIIDMIFIHCISHGEQQFILKFRHSRHLGFKVTITLGFTSDIWPFKLFIMYSLSCFEMRGWSAGVLLVRNIHKMMVITDVIPARRISIISNNKSCI
jgi:hypothetical protein